MEEISGDASKEVRVYVCLYVSRCTHLIYIVIVCICMYVHIGRSVLGLLIDRVPLTSEKKAHKVLHLCQRFKLKEQGAYVCTGNWTDVSVIYLG